MSDKLETAEALTARMRGLEVPQLAELLTITEAGLPGRCVNSVAVLSDARARLLAFEAAVAPLVDHCSACIDGRHSVSRAQAMLGRKPKRGESHTAQIPCTRCAPARALLGRTVEVT